MAGNNKLSAGFNLLNSFGNNDSAIVAVDAKVQVAIGGLVAAGPGRFHFAD